MTAEPMKLLSASVVQKLFDEIETNTERYRSEDFSALSTESGWAIESVLAEWDPAIASRLDASGTPSAEVENSLLIYRGMKGMTPALAREERLWARLCHVECLEYARERWLKTEDNVVRDVQLHFFANGLPGCRDENAIGRLWWNGHLASLGAPSNLEEGLQRLLARANIRLQIMDRADTSFREPLIRGILRLLGQESWFNSYDAAIADFMYEVNKRSGGIMFEAFDEVTVDVHLDECLEFAKLRVASREHFSQMSHV
ncbi:MAG TPA: DUF6339 family protein [Acidobacteriaceae bacterium]|jgi:hypothetical protein|nr:DUF6339 family protein [Acidobacteriaceae bacterium]